MNMARLPTLSQPFITQEIIFSHRSRQTDSQSQASFLKLSQKNSLELRCLPQPGLFQDMAVRLEALQGNEMKKLKDITNQIRRYEQQVHLQSSINKESKENQQLTYRKLKPNLYQFQQFELQNFEMDEHLNYVKNQSSQQNGVSEMKIKVKQCQQSIRRQSLQTSKKQGGGRMALSQNQYLSPPKSRISQKGISTSRTKRKTTLSSCKEQSKRPRVYEQILSLYTTAKLLAMQKRQ